MTETLTNDQPVVYWQSDRTQFARDAGTMLRRGDVRALFEGLALAQSTDRPLPELAADAYDRDQLRIDRRAAYRAYVTAAEERVRQQDAMRVDPSFLAQLNADLETTQKILQAFVQLSGPERAAIIRRGVEHPVPESFRRWYAPEIAYLIAKNVYDDLGAIEDVLEDHRSRQHQADVARAQAEAAKRQAKSEVDKALESYIEAKASERRSRVAIQAENAYDLALVAIQKAVGTDKKLKVTFKDDGRWSEVHVDHGPAPVTAPDPKPTATTKPKRPAAPPADSEPTPRRYRPYPSRCLHDRL